MKITPVIVALMFVGCAAERHQQAQAISAGDLKAYLAEVNDKSKMEILIPEKGWSTLNFGEIRAVMEPSRSRTQNKPQWP
jgi:hypothetical protein